MLTGLRETRLVGIVSVTAEGRRGAGSENQEQHVKCLETLFHDARGPREVLITAGKRPL